MSITKNTSEINQNLSDALGIDNPVEIYDHKRTQVTRKIDQLPEGKSEAEVDFDEVRSNTYELIEDAMSAVKELVEISSRSQDHESYASLATLIKTVSALNNDLINMQEKKKKVLDNVKDDHTTNVTNNNLILTTAELQELLANKK